MRVKNTISLPMHISKYLADDFLRLIGVNSSYINVITIEPESLNIISQFSINAILHDFYQPCLDDNCIYIPTKLGQILVLDKFSGELISAINLKFRYIMSDLSQNRTRLFCIGAIPINTKFKLQLDKYCVCIFDKDKCIELVQTNYFVGPPAFLNVDEEHLYITGGQYLYKFTTNGEQKSKIKWRVPPDLPSLFIDPYILCLYKSGIINVFNCHDLSKYTTIKGQSMKSFPAITSNSEIMWFTDKGIYYVDFQKQDSYHFLLNNSLESPEISSTKSHLFGCDQNGRIMSIGLKDHSTQMIKLANGKLRKPIIVGKYLFTLSDNKLHHLEVE